MKQAKRPASLDWNKTIDSESRAGGWGGGAVGVERLKKNRQEKKRDKKEKSY